MNTNQTFRLRNLGFGARIGLLFMLFALFGGYIIAAGMHLKDHHQNRDGREGFSLTDIQGVYHGVTVEAPLRATLQRNHPNELVTDDLKLTKEDKDILIKWLDGGQLPNNYDNVDFAELTPKEVIEINCLDCHAGSAENGAGINLEFWDDVQKVAFDNVVNPVDEKILLASTHAHASTMGAISIIIALLLWFTGWPRILVNLLIFFAGLGLVVDLSSMWLARSYEAFSPLIGIAGVTHAGSMALAMLLLMLELLLPGIPGCPGVSASKK